MDSNFPQMLGNLNTNRITLNGDFHNLYKFVSLKAQ